MLRPTLRQINNPQLRMGVGNNNYFYQGALDEVRIWSVQRSQAQIAANMYNELSGSENNLKAYYNFNQGTPGGNNGAITEATALAGNNAPQAAHHIYEPKADRWREGAPLEAAAWADVREQLSDKLQRSTFPRGGRTSQVHDRHDVPVHEDPDAWTVQGRLRFSRAPIWGVGGVTPRPAMVRVYAIAEPGGRWHVLPGGMTRVAKSDELSVSMQRGGSSLDTWVLTDGPVDSFSMLPRRLQVEFSGVVQQHTDAHGGEVSADDIWNLFRQAYLENAGPVRYREHHLFEHGEAQGIRLSVDIDGVPHLLTGEGNGPINAAMHALESAGIKVQVRSYEERSMVPMGEDGNARACAFVEMAAAGDAQATVLEPGAAALFGPETLIGDRLIDQPRDQQVRALPIAAVEAEQRRQDGQALVAVAPQVDRGLKVALKRRAHGLLHRRVGSHRSAERRHRRTADR